MKELIRCYDQFKGESNEQMHLWIRNIGNEFVNGSKSGLGGLKLICMSMGKKSLHCYKFVKVKGNLV